MINNKIKLLTENIINELPEQLTNDLYFGKMGICIYLFILSRYTNNDKYKEKAEELIDDICNNLSLSDEISFENGLSGIAWGIEYLILQKYIDADADYVLSEIDDFIFRKISSKTIEELSKMQLQLLGILIYFIYRIKNKINYKTESVQLKKDLIIHLINSIDTINNKDEYVKILNEPLSFNITKFNFPIYIYILSELYKLNFYNVKLDRIIDGLTPFIIRCFPLLHTNRIYLLSAIYDLYLQKNLSCWEKHINILKNNIDIDYMLQNEFLDMSVDINAGLSGLLFILQVFPNTDKLLFKDIICKKIVCKMNMSSYFNNKNYSVGLLTGISGIALSLLLYEMNKINNNDL